MAAASIILRSGSPYHGPLPRDRTARRVALGVAVAFHLVLLVALLSYAPARSALQRSAPIVISIITPTTEPVPLPATPMVQPRPKLVRHPVEPPPIAMVPAEAPTEAVAVPVQPDRVAPTETLSAPVAIAAPAPPAPVLPPRFNADYLRNPSPPYPGLARRMREQGKVVLRVLVSAEGFAQTVELHSSSGSVRLDQSAQDTVRTWKFVPARRGDQNVAAWVLVPIAFSLEG